MSDMFQRAPRFVTSVVVCVRTRSGVLCLTVPQMISAPISPHSSGFIRSYVLFLLGFFFFFFDWFKIFQAGTCCPHKHTHTLSLSLSTILHEESQSFTSGVGYFPLLIKPCVHLCFMYLWPWALFLGKKMLVVCCD